MCVERARAAHRRRRKRDPRPFFSKQQANRGAALRRRARAERECDLRCRDADYRRDLNLAAAARDVRAADVAWRALRASTRDAGWSPLGGGRDGSDDDDDEGTDGAAAASLRRRAPSSSSNETKTRKAPRKWRVATTHRDFRGRRALLVPAPRFASHQPGQERVVQRRFNVDFLEATPEKKASML